MNRPYRQRIAVQQKRKVYIPNIAPNQYRSGSDSTNLIFTPPLVGESVRAAHRWGCCDTLSISQIHALPSPISGHEMPEIRRPHLDGASRRQLHRKHAAQRPSGVAPYQYLTRYLSIEAASYRNTSQALMVASSISRASGGRVREAQRDNCGTIFSPASMRGIAFSGLISVNSKK